MYRHTYVRTYVCIYVCLHIQQSIHQIAFLHTHTHTNTHARIVHKKPLKCPLQLYGANYNQAQFEALFIPVTASRSHNRPCSFPLQPRGHTSVPVHSRYSLEVTQASLNTPLAIVIHTGISHIPNVSRSPVLRNYHTVTITISITSSPYNSRSVLLNSFCGTGLRV